MVKLNNFLFFISSMVVPRGTAAPIILKWFLSRDVFIGTLFFNRTIIPMFLFYFLFLVFLHSKKFIHSMDGLKRKVFVIASYNNLIFIKERIGKSESIKIKTYLRFLPTLHFYLLESKIELSSLESLCGFLSFLFVCTFFYFVFSHKSERSMNRRKKKVYEIRRDFKLIIPLLILLFLSGACTKKPEIRIEVLALQTKTNRQLMAVAYINNNNINTAHGGVCICIMGVLLSNTKKIEFIKRLSLGYELHMGRERCCFRGFDYLHGPTSHSICGNLIIYEPFLTNNRLMLNHDHDESLRAYFFLINCFASAENVKLELENSLHRWMKNREHLTVSLTMFPQKRYFREKTSTTEVAIQTNLFTDLYASIIGNTRAGIGWYTSFMKLPFLFFIRIGFMLASSGGSRSLIHNCIKQKLRWH